MSAVCIVLDSSEYLMDGIKDTKTQDKLFEPIRPVGDSKHVPKLYIR